METIIAALTTGLIGFIVGRMSKKTKKVSGNGTGHSRENDRENHNDRVKPV